MSLTPERLRIARERKNLKQTQVRDRTGINNKTLSGYENGVSEPDLETLKVLADLYEVSVDWLSGYTDDPSPSKPYYTLTPKDERDIAKDLEKMMNDLESKEAMAFHGEPLDEETRELLRISLENSMRLAKEMAKKKFTPKKYRK